MALGTGKILAIDFDGTIVEHKYPQIGEEITGAFSTLKDLQRNGYILILWTVRHGELLDEAVDFCRQRGVKFYAVNSDQPDEVFNAKYTSRKIVADYYIDDRNIGGFVGWDNVREILLPEISMEENFNDESEVEFEKPKTSIFGKLFGKK